MKTSHHKLEPKIVNYGKYEDFSNNSFTEVLINELCKIIISKNNEGFKVFLWSLLESFQYYLRQIAYETSQRVTVNAVFALTL